MTMNQVKYLATILLLVGVQQAQAVGTLQGTNVGNTASVAYTVGGVGQPSVTSNTVNFLVDRRINLAVAEVGGTATSVIPGSIDRVTTFTVSNTTNGVQDFRLLASNDAAGAGTAFGDTDNFDGANVRMFVDSNGNATYDPALDTETFIDELGADQSRTVFVLVDIPVAQINGDTAGVTLRAFAANSGGAGALGADATQTAGADTPAVVDTVFGDTAGAPNTTGDLARDGSHSDDDEYDVVTAALTVIKSQTVISDPFNGGVNPKAIPGAVIEYCVDINNTGATQADAIVMTDAIPANTTYQAGTIRVGVAGVGTGCTSGTGAAEDDDAAGVGDAGDFNVTTAGAVTVRGGNVAAAARYKALFRITVN
ncbi:MAG: hypothetical protein HW392_601 [Steroidobacteraceae bacterium]|nr:hypothetical protein [Steroidobacteraceae bacterium]